MTTPEITQAMINAYDEYTHLTLDRRGFMEKLTKLAGSGAAAAAIAPLLAANSAQAAIVPEDDARLVAEDITWQGDGGEMKGYLVRPKDAAGKLPTVIVIHENRGLNPHISDVARRMALEGFVALAVDFLSPLGGTPADEEKAREMFSQLDAATDGRQWRGDGRLSRRPRRRETAKSARSASAGAAGRSTISRWTRPTSMPPWPITAGSRRPRTSPKIKAALLLQYAGTGRAHQCRHRRLQGGAEAAGKEFTVFVYEGAQHAFNNDTSEARYNKEAADLAWGRTVAFFKEKLS